MWYIHFRRWSCFASSNNPSNQKEKLPIGYHRQTWPPFKRLEVSVSYGSRFYRDGQGRANGRSYQEQLLSTLPARPQLKVKDLLTLKKHPEDHSQDTTCHCARCTLWNARITPKLSFQSLLRHCKHLYSPVHSWHRVHIHTHNAKQVNTHHSRKAPHTQTHTHREATAQRPSAIYKPRPLRSSLILGDEVAGTHGPSILLEVIPDFKFDLTWTCICLSLNYFNWIAFGFIISVTFYFNLSYSSSYFDLTPKWSWKMIAHSPNMPPRVKPTKPATCPRKMTVPPSSNTGASWGAICSFTSKEKPTESHSE